MYAHACAAYLSTYVVQTGTDDGDRTLTMQELRRVLEDATHQKLSDAVLSDLAMQIDANSDGQVTVAEFRDWSVCKLGAPLL